MFTSFEILAQDKMFIAININRFSSTSIRSKIGRAMKTQPTSQNFSISGKQLRRCDPVMKASLDWTKTVWVCECFVILKICPSAYWSSRSCHQNTLAVPAFVKLVHEIVIGQTTPQLLISSWSTMKRAIYNFSCFHSGLLFKFGILCCCPSRVLNHSVLGLVFWIQAFLEMDFPIISGTPLLKSYFHGNLHLFRSKFIFFLFSATLGIWVMC